MFQICIHTIFGAQMCILAQDGQKIAERSFPKGNEFDTFLDNIQLFLQDNQLSFEQIREWIVVVGPGPFTGMRTVVLTINTLAKLFPIRLFPLDAFTFLKITGNQHPYILEANKKEALLQYAINSEVVLCEYLSITPGTYAGYISTEVSALSPHISVNTRFDYTALFAYTSDKEPVYEMEPLYVKKPNITLPK